MRTAAAHEQTTWDVLIPPELKEVTFTRNAHSQVNHSMKGVFDNIKYHMDIKEPEPRIMDLWMQWRKASDELNLDNFMNTDTGKKI